MNYTLHQLQVFLKVVQEKSITKAAAELHLTQPAVSIQLKNLQDQFNIPLTEMIGKKLYVTDFGLEIAQAAEKIANEVYAINYKTLAYKKNLSGKLKLSIVSTAKYVMPFFLADFLKANEGVDLLMDVTNKSKVLKSLENNEIDFALVSVLPKLLSVENEIILENKLYLIGNNNQKFKKRAAPKSIFNELPLIYREDGSATRFVMENFFEKNNILVRKKMELTSNEAVKQAVIAGLGYSIMPLIGLRNELQNGDLQIIPVEGFPIKSDWRLIWLKDKTLSPIAAAFLQHIKKNKKAIHDEKFSWIHNYK